MANRRNLVVIALASVLVGALAGVGALQYAQIVAYGGVNPNAAEEGAPNPRVSFFRLRWGGTGLVKTPVKKAEPEAQVQAPTVKTMRGVAQ